MKPTKDQIERLAEAADDIAAILGGACVINSTALTVETPPAEVVKCLPDINPEYEYLSVTISYLHIGRKDEN